MPPGVQDRTVRITGADLEQLMRATALILTKLSQNPNYSRFTSTSVSYGGYSAGYGGNYGGRNAAAGPPPEVPCVVMLLTFHHGSCVLLQTTHSEWRWFCP